MVANIDLEKVMMSKEEKDMGNKVYVVIGEVGYYYERGNIIIVGVFTDKEKAEKIVKERKDNADEYAGIWMEERELNKIDG